jgi:hypothetical protein
MRKMFACARENSIWLYVGAAAVTLILILN